MTKKRKSRGQKVIDWIQKFCRIPEGPDVGREVKLRPFQKKIILRIYDNPAVTRRAIISVGRKNAKTTLAAFLLLAHVAGPEAVGRRNSQLYSSAQSKEQAGVIFELAAKIIRMSPELSAFCVVRDTVKQILCPEMGTKYRALSAEVKTSFGLGPAFIPHAVAMADRVGRGLPRLPARARAGRHRATADGRRHVSPPEGSAAGRRPPGGRGARRPRRGTWSR